VNNVGRFDLSFKSLAEQSPRTLLRLFGHVPIDDTALIEPIEREIALPLLSVDHAFRLTRGAEHWVEHFEAEVVLSADDLNKILKRSALLRLKTDQPVWTTIILLSRRHKPAVVPETLAILDGSIDLKVRPRFVALWELAASVALSSPVVEMLPLVGAMKATREELEEAIRRVSRIEDKELSGRLRAELVTWSGLNYNENETGEIRRRASMVTTEQVFLASLVGEQAVRDVKLWEAQGNLAVVIESRFPGLMDNAAIDALSDIEKVRALIKAVAKAPSLDEARTAVDRILNPD